jgi:protein-L-isoaspartate(D-aspartate) O-methyltransferase
LPRIYAEQLVSGGMMVAPVLQENGAVRMIRLVKTGSRFEHTELFDTPYQPVVQRVAQYL